MLIDLQLHSTYSDGYLSPRDLVKFIAKQGIKVAALTDHNTVGGLDEFALACKTYGIKHIIGIELYVKFNNKKFNLLWFNFDRRSPDLHKLLRNTQIRRRSKVRNILNKLNQIGFQIDANAILDKYTHYVPDNRIIDDVLRVKANRDKVMKDLGSNVREEEIIRTYFYNKDIGRLFESYIDIKTVMALRKKIGGQIILNHPGKYNQLNKHFLASLKKAGIDGIEVLSPHHSIGAVMYAQFMAKELGLIMSGGSDFHRFETNNGSIHSAWQYFKIDSSLLDGVEKIIKQ